MKTIQYLRIKNHMFDIINTHNTALAKRILIAFRNFLESRKFPDIWKICQVFVQSKNKKKTM